MIKAEDLGAFGTLLDKQKSDTTEAIYEIRWNKETGYHCDCQGCLSSKTKPKTCKHIKRFCFKYKIEQLLEAGINQTKATPESILDVAIGNWKGEI